MGDDVEAKEESTPTDPVGVLIDTKKLSNKFVGLSEKEVPVPELNSLMGLNDGEVAVVKVRQLSLDDYLSCQQMTEDKMRNLIEGILAAAEKMGEVQDEVLAAYRGLSVKSRYYIDICIKGTIEPKFKKQDWIFLARMYPLVIEKVAGVIMSITHGGASLKKNS